MKKNEIDEKLNILGKLRNREELLSEDKLRSIIDKKSKQTKLSNVKLNKFRRLIMPISGAGIIISALLLIFSNQTEEPVNISGSSKMKTIKQANQVKKVNIVDQNVIKDDVISEEVNMPMAADNSAPANKTIERRTITEHYGNPWNNPDNAISSETDDYFEYKGIKVKKLNSIKMNWRSSLRSSSGFALKQNDNSILLHPSAGRRNEAESIGGIVVLKLSKFELEDIGVKINHEKVEFITEKTDRIHPVDYQRMDEYRNDTEVQRYVDAGYPTDGRLLCIKERIGVKINDWSIREERRKIERKIKDLNYSGYDSRWPEEKRKAAQDVNNRINELSIIKERIAQDIELLDYDTNGNEKFSGISPLLYTCTFKDPGNNILHRIFKTPLFFVKNPSHPLFLTNSDQFYKDMIPVEINMDEYFDDSDDMIAERVVLWYYPTDEFINALPERYSSKLRMEVEILRQVRSGTLPEEEACKGFTEDESFYDICRIYSGPIRIENIFPNPVFSNATLKFDLKQKTMVSINIYRSDGTFVREVRGGETLEAGKYSINLNLSGLDQGIYLASVNASGGETAVIKFVKQ